MMDYAAEYKFLFETSNYDLDDYLRGLALDLKFLRGTRFRSICWRIFLDCLPESRSEWPQAIHRKRREYEEKIAEFQLNPREEDGDDPLSQDGCSKWNKYFQDEDLRQLIQQDVQRTWPEIDVFQSRDVHQMMITILFYYSRSKPSLSYRQGMHEILAPIVYVIDNDRREFEEAKINGHLDDLSDANTEILAEIMDPKYAAHDAYTMFCSLMETMESWYSCSENGISAETEPLLFSKSMIESQTVLGLKLNKINQHILKKLDASLQAYLENLEINSQLYGIRWLRLLFGREYPLESVLCLWDTIFADSISLDLADYIFAAMLVAIRDRLLSTDYSGCLGLLMRFPDDVDVDYVLRLALNFRDHYKYPLPVAPMKEAKVEKKSAVIRPQTLNFESPESENTDWQYMVSSGSGGIQRELKMTSTRKFEEIKNRVAECALSMDPLLTIIQQSLISAGGSEEALVALAQLKSTRNQLKEISGADDICDEEEWTMVNEEPINAHTNSSLNLIKKKINGLMH